MQQLISCAEQVAREGVDQILDVELFTKLNVRVLRGGLADGLSDLQLGLVWQHATATALRSDLRNLHNLLNRHRPSDSDVICVKD